MLLCVIKHISRSSYKKPTEIYAAEVTFSIMSDDVSLRRNQYRRYFLSAMDGKRMLCMLFSVRTAVTPISPTTLTYCLGH